MRRFFAHARLKYVSHPQNVLSELGFANSCEDVYKRQRNVFQPGMSEKPTHIALYDLVEERCLEEFDLEAHGMNIIFSIFPAAPYKNSASG